MACGAAVGGAHEDAAVLAGELRGRDDHGSDRALVVRACPLHGGRGDMAGRDAGMEPIGGEDAAHGAGETARVMARVIAHVDGGPGGRVRPYDAEGIRHARDVLLGESFVEPRVPAVVAESDYGIAPAIQDDRGHRDPTLRRRRRRLRGRRAPCARSSQPRRRGFPCRTPRRDRPRARTSPRRRAGAA